MILSKMVHPAKCLKRNCRRSKRQKLKREMTELLHSQPNRCGIEEFEESITSPEESDWYLEHLRFEDELREEREDEMYEQDMATDDYRFRNRLGEYEGWKDYDDQLGDCF
jgi:hypothetical protein